MAVVTSASTRRFQPAPPVLRPGRHVEAGFRRPVPCRSWAFPRRPFCGLGDTSRRAFVVRFLAARGPWRLPVHGLFEADRDGRRRWLAGRLPRLIVPIRAVIVRGLAGRGCWRLLACGLLESDGDRRESRRCTWRAACQPQDDDRQGQQCRGGPPPVPGPGSDGWDRRRNLALGGSGLPGPERGTPGFHGLRAVPGFPCQCLVHCRQPRAVGSRNRFGEWPAVVAQGAVGCAREWLSSQDAVRDGRQGVDVARGALAAAARVLLNRRVAGGEDLRVCAVPLLGAGGTEVDQDGFAGRGSDHDVRGLDVAVQVAVRVHVLQPIEECVQPGPPFLGRQAAAPVQDGFQGFALDVLHDDVRRSVGFQIPVRLHDVRVSETVDRPGFLQEPFETPAEGLPVRGRRDRDPGAVDTGREVGGEVLLESYRPVELMIEGKVGDSEAAGAEHADDLVLGYPVSGRQSGSGRFGGHASRIVPARPPPDRPAVRHGHRRRRPRGR